VARGGGLWARVHGDPRWGLLQKPLGAHPYALVYRRKLELGLGLQRSPVSRVLVHGELGLGRDELGLGRDELGLGRDELGLGRDELGLGRDELVLLFLFAFED
jgi:hypothetical protein